MDDIKKIKPFDFSFMTVKDEEEIKRLEAEQAVREEEQRKETLRRHYASEKSGVNKKFWALSLSDYVVETEEQKTALETAKNFSAYPENRLLLICGSFGTGKTMLGSALIRELGGKYTTAFRLCLEYESSADFRAKMSKVELLDYYSSLPFLVIDEVGTGDKAQVEKELLPNILSQRYENELPSCIITNLSKKEVVEMLGKRILDRMTEVCTSITFAGESYRKKLRKQ